MTDEVIKDGVILLVAILVTVIIVMVVSAYQAGKKINAEMDAIDDGILDEHPGYPDKPAKHHSFEHMLDAIEWVESRGDPNAIGQDGEVGAYQLKECYVDDCNRILQQKCSAVIELYEDRLDKMKSRQITAYVTHHYAQHDMRDKPYNRSQFIETAARSHNSPANRNNSKTDAYWSLIKTRMEEVNPYYLWKE